MTSDIVSPLFIFLLCLVRIMAIFRTAPFLSGQVISDTIRNTLAMSLVLLVYPIVAAQVPDGVELSIKLIPLVFKEILIGVLMGFLLGMLFWTADGVGFLIDNQRGSSMASSMDPLSGEQSSPLGSLFFQAVTMLFFLSGGFVSFVGFVMQSYQTWPLFSYAPTLNDGPLLQLFMGQLDAMARILIVLAGPILIICFLTDFGLGLINRFAPQLNVFFLAMPIKSGLAMFFLILYVSVLLDIFKGSISTMDAQFAHLQEVFR